MCIRDRVGLPLVGKTTFFNLLTNAHAEISNFASGKVASNIGSAKIPDRRIDFLSKLYLSLIHISEPTRPY